MSTRARNASSRPPLVEAQCAEPPWQAPLMPEAELARIPASATIAGMFPLAVLTELQRIGRTLPSARVRYTPFTFYPLVEHARLMVEACSILFPDKPLRQALRTLGRGAPAALLSSTLGRVTLGAVDDPLAAIDALTKTYALNLRPGQARVASGSSKHAVIELRDVHYFLDCHHVGVFEGVLHHAQVKGTVRIAVASASQCLMRLDWA